MSEKKLTSSLSYCAAQVERFDHDRFLCTLMAPAALREKLFALYALNIELARTREVVREPLMGGIRLQWWREAIAELYTGQIRRHEVLAGLAHVLPGLVDEADVQAMIEARELDFAADPPTASELLEYARRIGGILMRAAVQICGVTNPVLLANAEKIGTGTALAGIIRSVPFHAAQDKCYLPVDLLEQMETDPHSLYRCFREKEAPSLAESIGATRQWLPIHTINLPLERSKINAVVAVVAQEAARLLAIETGRLSVPVLPAFLPAGLAKSFLKRLKKSGDDIFTVDLAGKPLSTPLTVLKTRFLRHA